MANILTNLAEGRAFFNSLGNIYPVDSSVTVTSESIDGVSCYWFMPIHFEQDKLIIYLHGGGFVWGSIHSHKAMVSHFATALSFRILFIEYALAPEKPFPNGLNDVMKVYRELIRKNPKATISVIGDSAGGGLAVSFLNNALKSALPLPASAALISPHLNLKCDTGSYETRQKLDPILTKEMVSAFANYYAGDNLDIANPAQLHFQSLPPVFILVGGNEILFDDSKYFYEKIKPLQANAKMKEYINQNHVWLLTDIKSEASKNALTDIKEFIDDAMN